MIRSILLASLAGTLLAGCTADLEAGCLSGPCASPDGGEVQPEAEPLPDDAGDGGLIASCDFTCDPASVGTDRTGELPCEVNAILTGNCQRCHIDPEPRPNNAPFPLVTYEDTQPPYGSTSRWEHMKSAIETNFMPLKPPKLTPSEKSALLTWLCGCAQPAPAGTMCP